MLFSFCISILLSCGFVFFSLPREVRRTVKANCRRIDGSWSQKRFRTEAKAVTEYVTAVIAPLTLAFLATFAASTYVFTYVMPFDLIVDSLQSFDTDTEKWRSNLSEVRKEHATFASANGLNEAEVQQLQKSLWVDWPAIALCVAMLLAVAHYAVFKTAGHAVGTWASGIRKRRTIYAKSDVVKMQNGGFAEKQTAPAS